MKISRRDFTRLSAAAAVGTGLGTILPSPLKGSSSVSPANRINVGLIGCNSMGWADLNDMLLNPEVNCIALCDIDRNVLENRSSMLVKEKGVKPELYGDYRKLLERKDLDAVIIGTPDHWHCLMTVDACAAGKDVYVEKPLANSIGECYAMAAAAKKYNRIVQVGQQQRSGPEWKEAIDLVRSGVLGKVSLIKVWANFNYAAVKPSHDNRLPEGVDYDFWLGPAPKRPFDRLRFHGLWRMFWDYGGGLATDWGVHLTDMALWAKDIYNKAPDAVYAAGGKFRFPDYANETPDTMSVTYSFSDWTLTFESNAGIETGPWGRTYGVAFIGSNGTLVADRDNWEVIREKDGDKPRIEAIPKRISKNEMHVLHTKNFIDCLKTRKVPVCDIETGKTAAVFTHLGNIALKTGNSLIYDWEKAAFRNNKDADKYIKPVYREPWKFPEM